MRRRVRDDRARRRLDGVARNCEREDEMSCVTRRAWRLRQSSCSSSAWSRPGRSARRRASSPKAGGTYRVAFEQAFGFSDGFDPTGEYYTYSFAIESNLMIRTLVGYDHVAGRGGEQARAGPRDDRAGADGRRQDVHLPPQARRQVRAAGRPAGHLEGRALRDRADRQPEGRRRVRLLLLADRRASTPTARARRRRSPGSRRRTRARSSST